MQLNHSANCRSHIDDTVENTLKNYGLRGRKPPVTAVTNECTVITIGCNCNVVMAIWDLSFPIS